MNKNLKIFITTIFGIAIFFILLKGLDNPNIYSPENIVNKIDLNISLKSFTDEKEFSIKELAGEENFALINIWASWCLPCREEHLYLMKLKDNNINIIGINYRDQRKNAKIFIESMGNPYNKILTDDDGTKSIELGAIGIPETYLINISKNKILKKYIGPLDQKKIDEILKIIQ